MIVQPGYNPLPALEKLAKNKKKADFKVVSLGAGQDQRAEILIFKARNQGKWILLENLHLFPTWLNKLENIISDLENSIFDKPHHQFRLWLTTHASPLIPS